MEVWGIGWIVNLMKGIDTIFEGVTTTPMDPQCVKGLLEITLAIMDLERALYLWILLLEKREDLMPTLYE